MANNTNVTGATLIGVNSVPGYSSTGTLGTAVGGRFYVQNTNASGTITNAYGLQVSDIENNNSGTISNVAGVNIGNQTGTGDRTNLLIGTTVIPAGDFSIYNSSAYDNYFAGNLGIADTSPSNPLSINGLNTASASAQAAIYTGAVGNIGLVVQGVSSQSADLVVVENTSGNDYFVIDAVGNVGIGPDTDPTYILDVQDSGTNIVNIQSTDAGGTAGIRLSEDTGDVEIRYNGTNNVLEIVGSAADPGEFYFDRDRGYVEFGSGLVGGLDGTFTDGDPVLATYSEEEDNQLYIAANGTDVDSLITFSDAGASNWSLGLDDSDSDTLKLSRGTVLGTNDYFSLTTTGLATFQGASVTVGTITQAGSLILNDGDGEIATIQTASLGSNETYILPDSDGSDTFCLLDLGNCSGSATTLQGSYDADADGSDTIISLSSADDSLIFRNPAAGGTDSVFLQQLVNLETGNTGNFTVLDINGGGSFDTTAGNRSSYGLDINVASTESAGSNTLTNVGLRVDVSGGDTNYSGLFNGGNFGIGTTAPDVLFTVAEDGAAPTGGYSADTVAVFRGRNFNSAFITIQSDAGSDTSGIYFADDGNEDQGVIAYNHTQNDLIFNVNGLTNNPFVLDSNETVVIGGGSFDEAGVDLAVLPNNINEPTWSATPNIVFSNNGAGVNDLVISNLAGNSTGQIIYNFGDQDDDNIGQIVYDNANNDFEFVTNAATVLTLSSAQNATFAGDVDVDGGQLSVYDGTANTFTIQAEGAIGGDYTVSIPTEISGADFFCLENAGNCSGASLTLQDAYDNSVGGGTYEIVLDSTRGALQIQDAVGVSGDLFDILDTSGNAFVSFQDDGFFTFSSQADTDAILRVDSGSTTAQNSDVRFQDQGTLEWTIRKDSSNNLLVQEADTSLDRLAFVNSGNTVVRSGSDSSSILFQDGVSTNILAVNGSSDAVGIGTTSPTGVARLEVTGNTATGSIESIGNLNGDLRYAVASGEQTSGFSATVDAAPNADADGQFFALYGAASADVGGTRLNTATVGGVRGNAIQTNAGILNVAVGGQFGVQLAGGSATGNISEGYGIQVLNPTQVSGATGNVVDSVGIRIAEQTAGTDDNVNLLIGTLTVPNADYSIYNASTLDNYFAGDVGIGVTSPGAPLQVSNNPGTLPAISGNTLAVFERTSAGSLDANISIISGNAGNASVYFGDTDSETVARIGYSHDQNELRVFNGSNGITVETDGSVGINNAAPGAFLSVSAGGAENAGQFISSDGRVYVELQDSVDSAFITNDSNYLGLGGTALVTDGLGVRVDLQAAGIGIGDGSGNYANIRSEALAANYNVDIPTITGDDTFCLETLNNCAGGTGTDDEFITVAADDSSAAKKAAADYTATASSSEDAINSAISAVNTAGGGTVYLMEGTYTIDATISLLDDVQIIGDGPQATIITVGASHNANLDFFSESTNPDNWAIRDLSIDINDDGHGTGNYIGVDLSAVGASNARTGEISNVEIYDFNGASDRGVNVAGTGADNLVIRNSHFWDGETAIEVAPTSGIWDGTRITDNIFEGMDSAAISLTDTYGTVISGNTVRDFTVTADQGAIDLIGAENTSITNNTFENLAGYGIESSFVDYNTTVIGNTFRDISSSGILGNFENSTIVGNTLSNVGTDAAESGIELLNTSVSTVADNIIFGPNTDGIIVDAGTLVTVTGNQIEVVGSNGIDIVNGSTEVVVSENVVYQAGDNGIRIDASSNNIVSDNFVTQSGISTATADGIHLSGNSDNNQVISNQITDTAGTGSAIESAASTVDNTYLADNTFSGTGATSISDSGTNTIYANQTNGASTSTATDLILQPADNVGIGTTAPDAKLTVVESGSTPTGGYLADTVIVAQNTDAARNAYLSLTSAAGFETGIYFGDVDNADEALLVFDSGEDSGAGQLEYYADPTTFASFLIDSSGDVAITGQSTDADDGTRLRVYNGSFTTWGALSAYTAGTDTVARFASDQSTINNAGIAIQAGTAANTFIAFGDTDDADIGLIDYDNNNNSLGLYTNNALALTIDSSQNVGIGAASPQALLHISGTTGEGLPTLDDDVVAIFQNNDAADDTEVDFLAGGTGQIRLNFGDFNDEDAGFIEFNNNTNDFNVYTPNEFNVLGTGTGITANTNVLSVTNTGSTFDTTAGNLTSYGLNINNTASESAGGNVLTNVGLNVNVSGGDTNYAAIFQGGNVGIGQSAPTTILEIGVADTGTGNDATVYINGLGTGTDEGAQISLGVSADHDGTFQDFNLDVFEDDFRIHNNGTTKFLIQGDSGSTRISASTDTSSILDVQDAGGQSYLTVDSESATDVLKVAIGEGTDDVVFVLDAFNSDPGGTVPDGAMFYDADDDQFRCRVNGSWTDCINGGGGGATTTATLIPEFAGGILSADGSNNSGTLSSDWVNALSSAEGEQHNYYEWSTAQATAQDYDVVVRYQLPNNFNGMGAASSFSFWHEDPDGATTNAQITWTVYDEVDETQCFSTTFQGTTAGVWEQESASSLGSCSWSAGDFVTMVFKIQTTSGAGAHRLGEVEFQYDI